MRIILASLIFSVLYTGAASAQVYVVNNESDNVSVFFDTTDGSTITVDVGGSPAGLAATPNGDFVYVTNSGDNSVSVIRTSDNTVVDTVDLGLSSFPVGAVVTPNGDFVYVTNSGDNKVSVIRTSDNTVVDTVGVGNTPVGVAVLPNGSHVFVANTGGTVSVIRTSDNTVVATTSVGTAPFGITALQSGDFVFVANSGSDNVSVLNADGFNLFTVDVGDTPIGIASVDVEFEGPAVFVTNQGSNTLSVISSLFPLPPGSVSTIMDVGGSPSSIAATPGGELLFVTNRESNTLTQLQIGEGSGSSGWGVIDTFDTGDAPLAVALAPDTDADGVANTTDADSDNDGITNNDEMSEDGAEAQSAVALRNEDPNDPDGDGLDNLRDLDSDGDCIPDHFEAGGGNDGDGDGLSDDFVDIDMDGHHDEHDPDQTGNNLALPDTDGDGTPDFLDQDSDNDGRSDAREAGGLDEDGDGIHDEPEDLNGDGLADACHPETGTPLPILDLNSNGIPDHLEADGGGSSSCALASPGEAPSFPLYLLILAFILINRLWRRRTN